MQKDNKKILCISGGGIKGIASISFLSELLKEFRDEPKFTLVEYFDIFAGTSVGSIIVLALLCTEKTEAEIIELFLSGLSQRVLSPFFQFPDGLFAPKEITSILNTVQITPKYNGQKLKKALENFFGDTKLNSAKKRVFIPAFNLTHKKMEIFDSKNCTHSVVDVIMSSSAAPTLFPIYKFNNCWYMDGGVNANNPSLILHSKFPKAKILSVGTGRYIAHIDGKLCENWGGLQWIMGGLVDILLDDDIQTSICRNLMGDRFLHINSDIAKELMSSDNTTAHNIAQLIKLGKMWYSENRNQLRAWIFL